MLQSTKEEHGSHKRENCRRSDEKSEFLEHFELTSEEEDAGAQGCHAATQNADAHMFVGLLHFVGPLDVLGMLVLTA